MDRIMADAYLSLGGVLRQGSRVTGKDALAREGMVMATGKRMGPHQNATHLGFKVHAQGLELAADLELHFAPGAYVGLCRIENGLVNVCGLVSERLAPRDLRYTWRSFIGSLLHPSCREAFDAAIMDTTSLCFSAGLHYGLKPVLNDQSLYIGDRSLSIPPLSGNGMSIGMETSMMASRQLIAFARGTRPWKDALGRIQKDYYRRFRSRLVWAGGLQSLMLPMRHNLLREWTVACAKWHYRFLYRVTR
jgi:flavin-dependent dehydrogenase